MAERFSSRFGHRSGTAEISIREDAPPDFRAAVLQIANEEVELAPSDLRRIVCKVLRKRPDPSNWSEFPNVWDEVHDLVSRCDWFKVYDIIEAIWDDLDYERAERFAREVNSYFREAGIGWQLEGGRIETRGPESFELAVQGATSALERTGRTTAEAELQEALTDLSRRPKADVTGAIQHAMAAIECVARDICGDEKATLGAIVSKGRLDIPKPIDTALEKMWGYASEAGRHLREGRNPSRAEAELVVGVAAVLVTYLLAGEGS